MSRQADPRAVVLRVDPAGGADLAGSPLFAGGRDALLSKVAELVAGGGVHTIVTPNVDQVLVLPQDPAMADAYHRATVRITDGSPLVMLGRFLGARDLHRLTGADLLVQVAQVAPRHGWRVAVTGGAPGVADAAARNLHARFGTDAVAVDFPKIASVDDPKAREVVSALHAVEPDVVFVCLGAPKQDVWADHWRDELPAGVYVGAGAAVDFVAGTKRRAPRLVQQLGVEWVFRLAQEPRRLARRYLVRGPRFVAVVWRSVRAARGEHR